MCREDGVQREKCLSLGTGNFQIAQHLVKGAASLPKSLGVFLHFIHFQTTYVTLTQNIQGLSASRQKASGKP